MTSGTISGNWSKIASEHLSQRSIDLKCLYGHVKMLTLGHENKMIDMIGVRGIKQSAPVTLAMLEHFHTIGWVNIIEPYVDEAERQKMADTLAMVSQLAYEGGYRGSCLLQTDPRQEWHPHWNLARASIKFIDMDGELVEETQANFLRLSQQVLQA